MNRARTIVFCIFTISFMFVSCQTAQKIISGKKTRTEIVTKSYEKDGLSFSYPDNWQITKDEILESNARNIIVEDSDNSVLVITLFTSEFYVNLDEYAKDFTKGMSANIPVGKVSEMETTEINRTINNQNYAGLEGKYFITLMGTDVPHTVNFLSINKRKFNAVLMAQASDEDWEAADKEFQVIMNSLNFE